LGRGERTHSYTVRTFYQSDGTITPSFEIDGNHGSRKRACGCFCSCASILSPFPPFASCSASRLLSRFRSLPFAFPNSAPSGPEISVLGPAPSISPIAFRQRVATSQGGMLTGNIYQAYTSTILKNNHCKAALTGFK